MALHSERFSGGEAKRGFEAALRGARAVGHEPLKNKPEKRVKKKEHGPEGCMVLGDRGDRGLESLSLLR